MWQIHGGEPWGFSFSIFLILQKWQFCCEKTFSQVYLKKKFHGTGGHLALKTLAGPLKF
jgi:hypothetical protein